MNEWEGWDAGSGKQISEKEEKKYSSSVWRILLVVFGGCLLLTMFMHAKELLLKFNGKSARAVISTEPGKLYLDDESGNRIIIFMDREDAAFQNAGGEVEVYYYDYIRNAKPMTHISFWLFSYLFAGGLTVICAYKIWAIYLKKDKHASAETVG